jgi:uncharacterized membrane protein
VPAVRHEVKAMPRTHRPGFSRHDDQEAADRRTMSLAGLAVALCVVVLSLFVLRQLTAKTAVEDCLMSGRTNCDVVLARPR